MRYYIIAGERSGDLHAGNLVKAISKRDSNSLFRGFGGDYMKEAGVQLTVHYRELAFMGFAEVVANLNKISHNIDTCKKDILEFSPDVVILVDYGGFNTRIAKFAKKNKIRVFFYITPKVWAWYQRRALTLKKNVDRMFVILPFEKEFYQRFDWQVDYVGNPVVDAVKEFQPDHSFIEKNKLAKEKPLVAMLPGSRKQELGNVLPVLTSVARAFPDLQFAVAAVNNLEDKLYDTIRNLNNVKLIFDDTYNLLHHARAAIVTSGTATLETALLGVPQVVIYKTSAISYTIAKSFIKVPFISLVNLIAGRAVVKEMIQNDMNPTSISQELQRLVSEKSYRDEMKSAYDKIYKTLDIGSASENTAMLMMKYLKEDKGNQRKV